MQTTINQITPVEYELQIDATAQDLAPKIDKKLREQRAGMSLKGFRKGKVPMSILKKMFGESLVIDVVERSILQVFQDEIIEPGEHKVIGMPSFGDFDYKLDGDLHATLKFGVHPEIELKDISGEKIMKLVHEVTDEEIANEIKQLQMRDAELSDRTKGGIKKTDYVTIDMQRLDAESNTPIIGEREEDVAFFVDDEKLREALRESLLGKKVDATFRVDLPKEEEGMPSEDGAKDDAAAERVAYEVLVKEVKERTLPELDAEFIKQATREEAEDEAGLKTFIQSQIERSYAEESRKLLESELMTRMLELHDFPVPNAAVEVFINSFVEDIKRKNNNELPEGFDYQSFSAANRDYAEQQARWKLMRDTMVENESMEVTDEDRKEYFLEVSGGNEETASSFEQYYKSMSGAMDMINEQLLSKKLFEHLSSQVTLEEMNKDAYMEMLKAKREAQQEALKA